MGAHRWFLADPSLVGRSGHCARYLNAIVQPLMAQGHEVVVLANKLVSTDCIGAGPCHPIFSLKCEELPVALAAGTTGQDREMLARQLSASLAADLDAAADRFGFTDQDVLLINSLRHWSLAPLLDWLEARAPHGSPMVVAVLHYAPNLSADYEDLPAASYRSFFTRLRKSSARRRLLLVTDSQQLAGDYGALGDLAIPVVPIPHMPAEAEAASGLGRIPTVVFAGEARRDKGFHLLPAAIAAATARLGWSPNFRLQSFCTGPGETECLAATAQLGGIPQVQLLPEPLSDRDYEQLIADADLVIIPYQSGHYRTQTSGVYCEALALGKPVVAPIDSWVAHQISENRGGVLFETGSAEPLGAAICKAIEMLPQLADQARSASERWRQFHNPQAFIVAIEAGISDLQSGRIP